MAKSQKALNETLRNQFMELVKNALKDNDVLLTNSNEFAIPCIDEEGYEKYVTIKFSVPTGSRDGDLYDGYEVAETYKMKVAEREEKAKKSAEKKAEKIARDKKLREQKSVNKD